jgi:paraquat-inducible protein B
LEEFYRGVDIDTLSAIRISDDHIRVIAIAQMALRNDDSLVPDTLFWAVRPWISGANETGLSTLISGA